MNGSAERARADYPAGNPSNRQGDEHERAEPSAAMAEYVDGWTAAPDGYWHCKGCDHEAGCGHEPGCRIAQLETEIADEIAEIKRPT
jgi:hypothetical protein